MKRTIALIILDGWGYRESPEMNAILAARTPHWDSLWQRYPHTTISASGPDVGLPPGQMGNSEVGHLTMGAGRTIFQDLLRISNAIEAGSFCQNPLLQDLFKKIHHQHATLHVLGLLSNGGVHSHEDHIHALLTCAQQSGIQKIIVHAILDGRDTPPSSAQSFLLKLEQHARSLAQDHVDHPHPMTVQIGSISGRYYAMDRDKRYDRTQKFYELITEMKADYFAKTALEGLQNAYGRSETDEFVSPTVIGAPCPIHNHDAVIFMNFRSDRARQLSYALTDPHFNGFERRCRPQLSEFVTLTDYASDLQSTILFPSTIPTNTLGEFLQAKQLRQLRIAETEKYAHVTFFLNGGREHHFLGEDRILIPSPKVTTYDLKPEMSAFELTQRLTQEILNQTYDVIICNFANADMVGHTGHFSATVTAIETLDTCLGRIVQALQQVQGEALITSDHGNAEMMYDPLSQQAHTAHTSERVPLLYIGRQARFILNTGVLADIAPTLIHLLGYEPPKDMTGHCLLELQRSEGLGGAVEISLG